MVPYVKKLVLSQVSVEGRVLDVDEHGLFDGPGMAVNFFVYYVELFWVHWMSCSGTVLVDGGGGLEMFLDPFSQGSS